MRVSIHSRSLIVRVVLLVILLSVSMSCIMPTEGSDQVQKPPDIRSYQVYLAGGPDFSTIFGFNLSTGHLQSWTVPGATSAALAIAPDGRRFYMGGQTTIVRETGSFGIVTELPYAGTGGIAVAPSNEYVALLGGDLYILNTDDYSVYYHDTSEVYAGAFSSDGATFYAVGNIDKGAVNQRSYVFS